MKKKLLPWIIDHPPSNLASVISNIAHDKLSMADILCIRILYVCGKDENIDR